MRNDAILYPGSSSASFSSTKVEQALKDRRDAKEVKRNKLKPSAEIVFALIKSEMDSVMSVVNMDVEKATDERLFMAEIMARKKYVVYLKNLQNKLDIILREKS